MGAALSCCEPVAEPAGKGCIQYRVLLTETTPATHPATKALYLHQTQFCVLFF